MKMIINESIEMYLKYLHNLKKNEGNAGKAILILNICI